MPPLLEPDLPPLAAGVPGATAFYSSSPIGGIVASGADPRGLIVPGALSNVQSPAGNAPDTPEEAALIAGFRAARGAAAPAPRRPAAGGRRTAAAAPRGQPRSIAIDPAIIRQRLGANLTRGMGGTYLTQPFARPRGQAMTPLQERIAQQTARAQTYDASQRGASALPYAQADELTMGPTRNIPWSEVEGGVAGRDARSRATTEEFRQIGSNPPAPLPPLPAGFETRFDGGMTNLIGPGGIQLDSLPGQASQQQILLALSNYNLGAPAVAGGIVPTGPLPPAAGPLADLAAPIRRELPPKAP